jgi:hypothetical protein
MEKDDYLIDHSDFDWKNLLGSWEWLLEDEMEVAPWLVSRFGDLFFIDELGIVNWLNISDGELTEVASSEAEFIELLDTGDNADDWFLMPLVDDMVVAGKTLAAGQCYGFKTLPVLGGEFEASNVEVRTITDYWMACGHIHAQLDGLPDGTELDIDIPESGNSVRN